MVKFLVAVLLIVAGIAIPSNAHNLRKRQAFGTRYSLSAGYEDFVPEVREEFSCEGREYGYYADLANDCQIFHVCVPPNGQYTFFCGNQTIFDQRLLTCQDVNKATPCQSSEQYYDLNLNFGIQPRDQP